MKLKVSLTLDEHALGRVEKLAKRMRLNRSEMVDLLMRDALSQLENALNVFDQFDVDAVLAKFSADEREYFESLVDGDGYQSAGSMWAAAAFVRARAAGKARSVTGKAAR